MSYAIFNADEGWVESPWFDSEQEAINFITEATGMEWRELESDDYYVQNFTEEEMKRRDSAPEA
jgi:hypothetical protein